MMLAATPEDVLVDQLLQVAQDPDLRFRIYDHLREYCHQCRNKLNSLKLSIYLARRQAGSTSDGSWPEVEQLYQELETRVEEVQALCRPMLLVRVTLGLDLLIDDRRKNWSRLIADRGGALELVAPADRALASFDVDWLGRALDSVVAWRSSSGATAPSVRLRWWVEGGRAHIAWEESRTRRRATAQEPPATSWTLPVLARVALAHGGDYRIETDRGWRLEIVWPAEFITP